MNLEELLAIAARPWMQLALAFLLGVIVGAMVG